MKVSEMFPRRFLRGQDMTKSLLILINGIEEQELRAGPNKPAERAYVMFFDDVSNGKPARLSGVAYTPRKGHALVLRGALAKQIATILGTDETDEWRGRDVVIYTEAATVSGKPMQIMRARAPRRTTPPATQTPTAATAGSNDVIDPLNTAP